MDININWLTKNVTSQLSSLSGDRERFPKLEALSRLLLAMPDDIASKSDYDAVLHIRDAYGRAFEWCPFWYALVNHRRIKRMRETFFHLGKLINNYSDREHDRYRERYDDCDGADESGMF